ncbi:MAG: efflux transporter outer membrane subunit [Tistlia sp.]|uniref:efflux transporter outer membrane subunit n=1 Tax=Tistlia sp. TaxID=3057121 RepID=UPI0034A223BC
MPHRLLSASAALLLLGGCSLIPEIELPESPVEGLWPSGPAYQATAANAPLDPGQPSLADLGWREFFRSPELRALIERALDNNRDLRVAALDVERARALYRISRSELLPQVEAGAGFTRQRTAEDFSQTAGSRTNSRFEANVGTTAFELDLFGRIRSLNEEALQQYFATEEARRSTRIALIAEVANAYLALLADRELLALTEATLKAQQQSYDLTSARVGQGLGSQLDVAQARTAVETARANRSLYTRLVAQDRNALELLVGAPLPDDFGAAAPPVTTADFVTDVPPGLPSSLLLRRPDVRRAERELLAANANIGAARAAFWPTISLTASGGLASGELGQLFQAGSGAWLFSPSVSLPIFDAGRREADLEGARIEREIAVAQYEQSIQAGFREVADALAARGTLDDQIAAQRDLVGATQESYDLSLLRYDQGLDNFLTTLDSQRELYQAQQDLIALERQRLANLATLYKALGGGTGATSAEVVAGLDRPRALPTLD